MSVPEEITKLFYEGTRTEAVQFVANDSVRIKSGPQTGRAGAVTSVESL